MTRTFRDVVAEHQQVVEQSLEALESAFERVVDLAATALNAQRKVLVCGNGGSAADAQHFAAELVGRFEQEGPAWPAIALTTDSSAITAIGNDYGFEQVFARQVAALGQQGDLLIGISTSGNSPNVVCAMELARDRGLATVALTGAGGGALARLVDQLLAVPAWRTARVQEMHELLLHALAEQLEHRLAQATVR